MDKHLEEFVVAAFPGTAALGNFQRPQREVIHSQSEQEEHTNDQFRYSGRAVSLYGKRMTDPYVVFGSDDHDKPHRQEATDVGQEDCQLTGALGVKDGRVPDVSNPDDDQGDQEPDVGDGPRGQVQTTGRRALGLTEEHRQCQQAPDQTHEAEQGVRKLLDLCKYLDDIFWIMIHKAVVVRVIHGCGLSLFENLTVQIDVLLMQRTWKKIITCIEQSQCYI